MVSEIRSEGQQFPYRVYIGHTKDLDERLDYHNSGYVESTSSDIPWRLVAYQELNNRSEARWLERKLKKSKGRRNKWIEENRTEQ
jgi:putative endonuclease